MGAGEVRRKIARQDHAATQGLDRNLRAASGFGRQPGGSPIHNCNLRLLLRIEVVLLYYGTMFLYARLFSAPPLASAVLLGLVFVTGMLTGAALKLPSPALPGAQTNTPAMAQEPRAREPGLQDLKLSRGSHPAEVLRVNDGDTFEARVHVWPGMQVTTKVRLRGIDAAELKAQCAEEYRLAAAARDALERLLLEGGVTIGQIGLDKYGGRVLATASTRTTPDISEALLKTGLVRPYEGGRRESWCGISASR
jgi:endonuclease YncB( thermonuclease family)